MNRKIKKLERSIRIYEIQFQENYTEIRKNPDFEIQCLKGCLQITEEILENITNAMSIWCNVIQELHQIQGQNWFEKLKLRFLKWYANRRYVGILVECYRLEQVRQKLEYLTNRLETAKYFFST